MATGATLDSNDNGDNLAGGSDPGDEDDQATLAPSGEREDSGGDAVAADSTDANGAEAEGTSEDGDGRSRRGGRRRGRRGGRRNERDGMTEGNADGSPETSHDARADGHSEPHEPAAPRAAEPAPRQEAPMLNTQALDFSRDGDHPEKPDQFEPAPPKPAEAPKPVAPKTEAEAPKPRRADPVASTPVLERVVVSMDGTPGTTTAAAPADDKPVRKGWWQRKLAGE